jgi:hypothetical protein
VLTVGLAATTVALAVNGDGVAIITALLAALGALFLASANRRRRHQ